MPVSSVNPAAFPRVAQLLEETNIPVSRIAKALGVDRNAVYAWRRGQSITRPRLEALSEYLGVDPDELENGVQRVGDPESNQPTENRVAVLKKLNEGLSDETIEFLAGFTHETFGLVILAALERFARGIQKRN